MIRILFAVALGGSITLLVLSTTGSTRFTALGTTFAISTGVLFTLLFIWSFVRGSWRTRTAITEARENGRMKPALVVSRRQTGAYINENPQVEFTLLVPQSSRRPFLTKARSVVQMIDVHRIETGSVVTVAHPDAESGEVHLVLDEEPPPAPQTLTFDAVDQAAQLPDGRARTSTIGSLAAIICAFVVGAVGAPFLAVPNPLDYARLLVEGRTDEVRTLDHPVLFRIDELQQSLDSMVEELGHDTVYEIMIHEIMMIVEVPVGEDLSTSLEKTGADEFNPPIMLESDRVTVRDHRIIEHEPDPIGHLSSLGNAFSLSEVNWPGVFAGLETARELAVSRGLADAHLNLIHVTTDTSGLDRIEVNVTFAGERGSESISLDANGQLTADEQFATLTEAEREVYLLDPQRFESALIEALTTVGATHIVQILNYGDRMYIEAYIGDDDGGDVISIDFRDGHVSSVEAPEPAKIAAGELFTVDEMNWASIFAAIPVAQQTMAAGGAPNTEVNHITFEAWQLFSDDPIEVTARIYLRNEYGEGGSVLVSAEGVITRVQGP